MTIPQIFVVAFGVVTWIGLCWWTAKRSMPKLQQAGRAPKSRLWRTVWIIGGPITLFIYMGWFGVDVV